MRASEVRFTAGADIRAGETVTVDDRTGMLVPLGTPEPRTEYHDGVLFGIRHPGASQVGCTYCQTTLAQAKRWGHG